MMSNSRRVTMNIRIILSVFLAFGIAFSILFAVQYNIWNEHFIDQEDELFIQTIQEINSKFDLQEKKVFIFGSSQAKQLNITHIHETVSSKSEFSVYNLAIGGDTPKERLRRINTIIELNPEFVVYGIGYRDFQSITRVEELAVTKPYSTLPDPQEYFESFFISIEKILGQDFDFLQSTQLTTLRAVREALDEEKEIRDVPIQRNLAIMTEDDLKNPRWISQAPSKIQPLHMNKQFIALMELIQTLNEHGIKVVFFTTPHSPIFLDALPDYNKKQFDKILLEISSEFNIEVYHLHDKYDRIDIWSDATHVAYNPKSIIYSDDIAQIILNEIGS